jgi:hypothetical protein
MARTDVCGYSEFDWPLDGRAFAAHRFAAVEAGILTTIT